MACCRYCADNETGSWPQVRFKGTPSHLIQFYAIDNRTLRIREMHDKSMGKTAVSGVGCQSSLQAPGAWRRDSFGMLTCLRLRRSFTGRYDEHIDNSMSSGNSRNGGNVNMALGYQPMV